MPRALPLLSDSWVHFDRLLAVVIAGRRAVRQLALKDTSGGESTGQQQIKLAQRRLVSFPATADEIEATRLAVMNGCC